MALHLNVIDSEAVWEKFLLSYCPGALFQSWRWGDVQKSAGQDVYRYGLMEDTRLVGIAQIFIVRARRGTFLHVRHGPVWKEQKKSYWNEFLKLIADMAKKKKAWFVRVSPLIENSQSNRELFASLGLTSSPIHEVDAERCWVLDLDKSEDELLMGMRKTTRYEIRQAQKMGVTVRKSQDTKDLKYFYSLYSETSLRHGFVGHTSISEEFEAFSKVDKALLLLGYYEKEVIAATILLLYGGQAIYHHGASKLSRAPVSYLVQWEAILEAKKRGIKLYNFYGIAPDDKPKHPWRGITLFKKGFGGREINFIHAHDHAVSPLYIIPRTIEAVRKHIRGY